MMNRDFWKGKKIFLTGHTGFKGSWLSAWLIDMGAIVRGYSLEAPTKPNLFEALKIDSEMDSLQADVRDLKSLQSAMAAFNPDVGIHMAAQALVRESYINPVETFATNLMGTVNFLEACRSASDLRAAVVITTDKCYENREWLWPYREIEPLGGHDPYSASKGCAEIATAAYRRSFFGESADVMKRQTAVATVRAGNVIGGGDWARDRLIPDILRSISDDAEVVIRNPNAIRPWQHVLEPLSGYLALAERLYNNGFNLAGAWNFGPSDEDAKPVEWIVKKMLSFYPGNHGYSIDGGPHPHEANYLRLDSSKARSILGWKPRWDLETTLKRIIEWDTGYRNGADAKAMTVSQIVAFEAGNR